PLRRGAAPPTPKGGTLQRPAPPRRDVRWRAGRGVPGHGSWAGAPCGTCPSGPGRPPRWTRGRRTSTRGSARTPVRTDAGAVSFCDPVSWAAPTLCPQGGGHWSREELLSALPAFARVYSGRPFRRNLWGMNTNHAFALWFTVRALRPLHVIDGVHRGQSTWLLREAAGPDARLYALDPKADSFLRYRDEGRGARTPWGGTGTDIATSPMHR
ncbi:unnamed protein product, partial [Prorocentrum cordatum]